jgi:hypothetical protein
MGDEMSGQGSRRHPETPPYRCFLSDLTGFAGLRRAGPTRTAVRIPEVQGDVNINSEDKAFHTKNRSKSSSGTCGKFGLRWGIH